MSASTQVPPGNQFAASDSPTNLREGIRAFFTYPSPVILASLAIGSLILRGFFGPWDRYDALIALLPVLIWPFLEWSLHRYLLHLQPMRILGFTVDFDFAKKHRIHHQQPWRAKHIFLPVYVHILMAPLLTAGAFWLLPRPGLAATWMAALAAMALVYEWTHFIVHSRIRPKSRFAQRLFHNHRMHHFRNEHYWYSFTMPHVDVMFGTGPDDKTVPRSPTCRTLDYSGQGEMQDEAA